MATVAYASDASLTIITPLHCLVLRQISERERPDIKRRAGKSMPQYMR